jgi:hypothetical protein
MQHRRGVEVADLTIADAGCLEATPRIAFESTGAAALGGLPQRPLVAILTRIRGVKSSVGWACLERAEQVPTGGIRRSA